MKATIEGMFDNIQTEDHGTAKIATIVEEATQDLPGIFARIQSWDESLKHMVFAKFVGHRVRVTIETID